MMRPGLRWKILSFTVLPLVTLAFMTLWVVNASVTRQVHASIHEDLRRASAVLEDVLSARARELAVAGRVIVQDPKFFSVLTIPVPYTDPELRATVSGVARDFNSITEADLFEVMEARGRRVASVGEAVIDKSSSAAFVSEALDGRPVSGILVTKDAHFQVAVTPVVAGGRVVGVLLLGARIGRELASHLRSLTRSEVTFLSHGNPTASTLERVEERDAVRQRLMRLREEGALPQDGTLLEMDAGGQHFLTLVRGLPESIASQQQQYVMQRSLSAETAFLREIQTGLVELGIAAALIALIAGLVIAERITSPLQRLVRGAEEMERGNFDYPLEVRGRDEIGYLATRFQDMRQRQRVYIGSLEEVTRLKSEFLNVASHELRTPISVLTGYQELILGGMMGPLTDTQRDALDAMGKSLGTLSRIAEDATRMAQIESDRLTLVPAEHDVRELVEHSVDSVLSRAQERSVEVRIDVAADVHTVRADFTRLTQALGNLVSNGIRFTPDGGKVEIRVRNEREHLLMVVEDNGVGIDPERQRQAFDRSFGVRDTRHHHSSSTLEFNSAGLGLGLSIARGIIEAHGGTIRVESTIGKGTRFEIRLPAGVHGRLDKAA